MENKKKLTLEQVEKARLMVAQQEHKIQISQNRKAHLEKKQTSNELITYAIWVAQSRAFPKKQIP